MAIDMVALKAKLAALKNNIPAPVAEKEVTNETETNTNTEKAADVVADSTSRELSVSTGSGIPDTQVPATVSLTSTDVVGTAKTSEIDHLDFLNKMELLQQAIHKQHSTMPVLLMQIHKQLRADPELTSTLSDEGIGVIVKGLQIQTKTELVSVVVKESKSKKNKTALSVDLF